MMLFIDSEIPEMIHQGNNKYSGSHRLPMPLHCASACQSGCAPVSAKAQVWSRVIH